MRMGDKAIIADGWDRTRDSINDADLNKAILTVCYSLPGGQKIPQVIN